MMNCSHLKRVPCRDNGAHKITNGAAPYLSASGGIITRWAFRGSNGLSVLFVLIVTALTVHLIGCKDAKPSSAGVAKREIGRDAENFSNDRKTDSSSIVRLVFPISRTLTSACANPSPGWQVDPIYDTTAQFFEVRLIPPVGVSPLGTWTCTIFVYDNATPPSILSTASLLWSSSERCYIWIGDANTLGSGDYVLQFNVSDPTGPQYSTCAGLEITKIMETSGGVAQPRTR